MKNRPEIQNSSNQVIPAPKNYQRRQEDEQMDIDDEEDASKGLGQNSEIYTIDEIVDKILKQQSKLVRFWWFLSKYFQKFGWFLCRQKLTLLGYNQFMDNCETYFKEHEADFKPPARTGPAVAQSAPGAPPPSNPTTASTKAVSQSATGLPPRKEFEKFHKENTMCPNFA